MRVPKGRARWAMARPSLSSTGRAASSSTWFASSVRRAACESLLRRGETPEFSSLKKMLASEDRFEATAARRLLESTDPIARIAGGGELHPAEHPGADQGPDLDSVGTVRDEAARELIALSPGVAAVVLERQADGLRAKSCAGLAGRRSLSPMTGGSVRRCWNMRWSKG